MKKTILSMVLALGPVVLADDMPFWGNEPNLELIPSDAQTQTLVSFSSWTVFEWCRTLMRFRSTKPGFLVFFE